MISQKKYIRVFLIIAIAFALHVSHSIAANPINQGPYTHPERLISVAPGRKLNIYCTGSGTPTIVLEAGAGESSLTWAHVQPGIARFTRVCSYDRAGLGFSDFDPRPRDTAEITQDLQALVLAAKIKRPFILVAHSLGGLSSILFAYRYRQELSGLLLVDPSFAGQATKMAQVPGVESVFAAARKPDWRPCIGVAESHHLPTDPGLVSLCLDRDQGFGPALQKAADNADMRPEKWRSVASEAENFNALPMAGHVDRDSSEVEAEAKSLGSLRLVILTASSSFRLPGMSDSQIAIPGLLSEQIKALSETIKQGHDELAARSSRGVEIVVPDSGHYIQYDHPEVIIEQAKTLVNAARRRN